MHLLDMFFGFLREFVFLVSRIVSTVGHVIHEIWHELSAKIGALAFGRHGAFLFGRWQMHTSPAWLVASMGVTGFILLLVYSQWRPTSAKVDLVLSVLVGITGIVLLGLLD